MSVATGWWPSVYKTLLTTVALVGVMTATLALSSSFYRYTLIWPMTGASLLFAYYWGRPALVGVFLAALIHNWSNDWLWFSLLSWTGKAQPAPADTALLLVVCSVGMLQSWLGVRILRGYVADIRDGSLSLPGWIGLMLLVGPALCLLRTLALGFVFGWVNVPLAVENLLFASAMWVSTTLSVWMAVPVIVVGELRENMPRLAQNRLRNPRITLALVTSAAIALAAYLGLQQVQREQQRFENLGISFKNEIQADLDAAEQKLLLLRAFYRVTGDVSPAQFDQFAGELLDGSNLLLGLGWAEHISDAERARTEAALAAQRGVATPLTQVDDSGSLAAAPRRDEYWPLLRIAPQERKPLLGFDLASEAQRRAALLQSQNGGLAASARAISLRADGEHVPAVFLYLPTADPRGAVVAPLKIQALLGGHGMSRELLAGGHDLQLTNAGGETLAEMLAGPIRIRNADPHLAQEFALKIGSDVWHLTVATSKMALPYLSAPLWWLGQALPQLLCVLIGLFLALIANNDRRIFQLERYYAGYVEGLRKSAVPQTQAALFDAEIEGAWNERAFEPRFEPIVDIRSGEIRGAEALLRWPGAPEGLTTGDIIEWAERKNLIGDLDRGILSATLRAVASWPLARLPNFAISVNVSASEMQNPQWAGHVLQELARYRVAGRNLCFEITEGVLIRSDSVVLDQLALLRAAGVRIALDDFGTGYSSIAYLRQLPVDRIKLDRAFVSDLAADDKARRIVASILALGRTLEIDLVAEAVEDSRTVKVLRELGCQLAQGWFFSHTIGAQAMRDLLNTQLNGQRTRRA